MKSSTVSVASIRLSKVYSRGLILIPVYQTGETAGGKAIVEDCGVCFNRASDAQKWVKQNKRNFTGLSIASAKIS